MTPASSRVDDLEAFNGHIDETPTLSDEDLAWLAFEDVDRTESPVAFTGPQPFDPESEAERKKRDEEAEAERVRSKRDAASKELERRVLELNKTYALIIVGDKSAILDTSEPDRLSLWGKGTFMDFFANQEVVLYGQKGRVIPLSLGAAWLKHPKRRTFRRVVFAPGEMQLPADTYNLWRGWAIQPNAEAGKWSLLDHHIRYNIAGENDRTYTWVIHWLAHMLQRPQEKTGTGLVLRGIQGCGKSTLGEVMKRIMTRHVVIAEDERYIVGQFNSHLETCILLQCEEATWAGDKTTDGKLKSLATSKVQMIERKGQEPVEVKNCIRFLFTSNEDWVVPAGLRDRRWVTLDVRPDWQEEKERADLEDRPSQFDEMWKELEAGGLEAFMAHLLSVEIDLRLIRSVVDSAARTEQILHTLKGFDLWYYQFLAAGTFPSLPNAGRWISSKALYDHYLEFSQEIGYRRRGIETMLSAYLTNTINENHPQEARIEKTSKEWVLVTNEEGTLVTKRLAAFRFPSLKECRAAFRRHTGTAITWDNPEGNWSDYPDESPSSKVDAEQPSLGPTLEAGMDSDLPF